MVEGARLESVYTATYRGFESLSLRHLVVQASPLKAGKPNKIKASGFFYVRGCPIKSIEIRG